MNSAATLADAVANQSVLGQLVGGFPSNALSDRINQGLTRMNIPVAQADSQGNQLPSVASIPGLARTPGDTFSAGAAAAPDPKFVRVFQPQAHVQAGHSGAIDHSNPNNPGAVSAEEMARRTPMNDYQMARLRAAYTPIVSPKEQAANAYLNLIQQRFAEEQAAAARGQVLDPKSAGNLSRDRAIAGYQRFLPQGLGIGLSDEAQAASGAGMP